MLGEEDGDAGLVQIGSGGYMCLKCGKVLSTLSNGRRHVRESHHFNQTSQCRICKKVLKNERQRNDHYRNAHGVTANQMKNTIKVAPATNPAVDFDQDFYE